VKFVTLRILSVRSEDGTFRGGPYDDGQGIQVVNLGEVVTFDITARNLDNKPCETNGEPDWQVRDNLDASNRDYLSELNSNNPFLMRVRAVGRTTKTGKVQFWATLDGVVSNRLYVVVR
jgi:hypothetical protein